jgi:hypothetical protein
VAGQRAALTFLTAVGLTLEDALAWRAEFLSDMLGFVLLVDHRYDRAAPEVRSELHHPVPRRWLEAHPAVDAPLARAATTLTEYTSDDLFDRFTDRAITTIAALRRAESSTEAITEASAETAVGDART